MLYGQFVVEGRVYNSSQALLPDAFVFLQPSNLSTSTTNNGQYKFNNLNAGTYQVLVDAVGFQSKQINIEIVDKNIELNITLDSLNVFF
jgi:outer membrane receptor for ferrienterochelin and colicins